MGARLAPPSLSGKGAGGLGSSSHPSPGPSPKRGGEETPSRLRVLVLLFIAALVLAPVAHGCHGGDEDHEPAVAPRVETEAPRPSS